MFVDGSSKKEHREKAMGGKQGSAFITARKGFCYLTIKCGRRNFHVMRIRAYTLDADDKRQMRRLYPDIDFDWKKIARQLAEKREVCRRYRSRRRTSDAAHLSRVRAPFWPEVTKRAFLSHKRTNRELTPRGARSRVQGEEADIRHGFPLSRRRTTRRSRR
jgi:hypothetical protein